MITNKSVGKAWNFQSHSCRDKVREGFGWLSLLPLGFDVLQHFINMQPEPSGLCVLL